MSGFGNKSGPPYVANLNTDANGLLSWTIPNTSWRYHIQPMSAGEFTNNLTLVGTTMTVQFKKFKAGGLGITLGTLLSVTAFEDTSGVVNFNVIGAPDQ